MTAFEPEHLARLVELTDDLICVGGADGYFFRLSPSWTRTLGYTEQELRSRPFLEFVHPEDIRETAREVRRALRGAPTRQFANRLRHRDGHYRWLRWNVTPSHDAMYAYAVARDITEARAADQELARQAELLRATEDRLAEEIARAREVQLAFIPEHPLLLPWVDVSGQCVPAREMSGDFIDWYQLPDGRIVVTVGDVMGKGIPAALLMSTAQTLLRGGTYVSDGVAPADPGEQVERTNNALQSYLGSAERFVTAFSAQIDPAGVLLFADAGHGHALVRRRSGEFESLEATGLPLGVLAGASYPAERRQLEPGDVLLVATDGLRDVLESVGRGSWKACIAEAVSDWSSADAVVQDLVIWAEAATDGAGSADDLTLLVSVFRGGAAHGSPFVPTSTHEAVIAPVLGALAAAEHSARVFLVGAGLPPAVCEELVLGLHELLANIVVHAAPSAPIGLLIEVRGPHGALEVEIATRDDGEPYAPEPEVLAGVAVDRGRGLDICRRVFDSVGHVREDTLNIWVMTRDVGQHDRPRQAGRARPREHGGSTWDR